MGEFEGVCQRIADMIEEVRKRAGGVSADDLAKIAGEALGRGADEINCYPGMPGADCHDFAFFFSLRAPIAKGGKHLSHLNFLTALHKIVQHMQGSCPGITRQVVFFTDLWDATAYEEWKANIQQIQKHAHIEAYSFGGGKVKQMPL